MQNEMRDRLIELLGNRCCSKQIPCEICEYQNLAIVINMHLPTTLLKMA